jgi:osmotically-inducible protein OsmY
MKTISALAIIAAAAALFAFGVPASASKLDSRIEAAARDSYVFRTYLKDDDIKIESKEGVVTLTGTVSETSRSTLAKETIASLPGVKGVENKLMVKGDPTASTDAWLSDKLKISLLFHRSVSAGKADVTVKDGIVTLKGNAESQAQKELTTEYAKDIDGVKEVNNEMVVAESGKNAPRTPGEKIDDASITGQVRMALLLHRSTSVLTTTVSTKRGVVTVGGKAGNVAEKDLVTKLVSDINGVKSVKNLMTAD